MANLPRLIDELEKTTAATPKKNDSDYVPLINALDRVLDEIKSGEPIDAVLERAIAALRHLFGYPKWNLVQSSIYGIAAAFQNTKRPLEPLLHDNLHVLLEHLADDKREVRDATAQCLGVLSSKLGERLVQECKAGIERATKQNESWQTLEGFMIAVGYIACRASSLSPESLSFLCDVLIRHTSFSSIAGYSNYVRLQSLKALERLVRLGSIDKLWIGTELEAAIRRTALERMDDENIDARKAAARLHYAVLMKVLNVSGSSNIQQEIQALLDRINTASRWEQRHGLGTALTLICRQPTLIGSLSADFQSALATALAAQVKQPLVSADASQSASTIGSANAAAAVALTDLFLSQCQLESMSVDSLANAMSSLSLKFTSSGSGSASDRFAKELLPQLVHLLSSPEATLLDAGGQSVFRLVGNSFAAPAVKDHLGPLQCLIFKNKYHSSLPIRDSAVKNWKAVTTALGSEAEALSHLTPALIDFLLKECEAVNTDVRESVFKAFEEVIGQTVYPPKLKEGPMAENIFRALCKGTLNTAGKLPDYPRAAASAALSKFLSCAASNLRGQEQLVKTIKSELPKTLVEVLAADTENIVIEGLKCVASAIRHWDRELGDDALTVLVTPLICLAFSSYENVRFTAVPVMVSLFNGRFETAVFKNDALLAAFAKGLKARFSFSEEDNPEEESREGIARALLYIASQPGLAVVPSYKQHAAKLLSTAIQGALIELSRDSAVVQSNCMTAVSLMIPVVKQVGALNKCEALLKKLAAYIVAFASGKAEDFEFDPDEADEDGDDDDEEDEDNHDVELKEMTAEKLYLLLICTRVASSLASVGVDKASKCLSSLYATLLKKSNGETAHALHLCLELLNVPRMGDVPTPLANFDIASWKSASFEVKLATLCSVQAPATDGESSNLCQAVIKCMKSCGSTSIQDSEIRCNAFLALKKLAVGSSTGPVLKAIAESLPVDSLEDDSETASAVQSPLHKLSITGAFSPFAVVATGLDVAVELAKKFPAEAGIAVAGLSSLVHEASEEESEDLQVGHIMVLEHLAQSGCSVPEDLLTDVLSIINRVQGEDDAPETFAALCLLAAVLVQNTPADKLSEDMLEMFATKLNTKWILSVADGNAAVALLRAAAPLLQRFQSSKAFSSIVQSLADILANEDIGSVKSSLLEVTELLPALGVRFLPTPTPIDAARINETFSKKA